MKTKTKTDDVKKEDDNKPVNVNDYKGENDESLEGAEVKDPGEIDESKIKDVETASIDIETTDHFDTQTDEFLQKIKALPTFTREDEQQIVKHYNDKKAAWELSHVNDIAFPIRFKKRKDTKNSDFVEYETEMKTEGDITRQQFIYEQKHFQGQSMTPVHKDKMTGMENSEQIFYSELDKIERDIQNIVTIRNTVGAILSVSNAEGKGKSITADELKSYMKKLDDAIKKLPDNLGDKIREIKNNADEVTRKKNKFIAYAYFSISPEDYEDAYFNDIRDYVGVIQRRDSLKVPY